MLELSDASLGSFIGCATPQQEQMTLSFEQGLSDKYTPLYHLIDKFLQEKSVKQDQAMAQLAPILAQLAPLLRQAGLTA